MYTNHAPARRVLAAAAGLFGAACLTSPADGQSPAPARIEGVVTDSLHARRLAGATVVAMRLAPASQSLRMAIADAAGRFVLDSLDAGRYAVTFFAPLTDSLELMLPDHAVAIEAGARVQMELAVPSARTLRAAACPGLALPPGEGAVLGIVSDARTDRPLAGATVVVAWNDIVLDRVAMKAETHARTGAVPVDSLGRYRLCGVPTNSTLALQVQQGGAVGSVMEVVVDDSIGMLARNLAFSVEDTVRDLPANVTQDTLKQLPAATGTATITGVVLGAEGRPVPDVQLRIASARGTARSDSAGRFELAGLPAGSQMLEARRIGYTAVRVPVTLRAGASVAREVRLTHVVSLDSIRIVARRNRYPEFELHRRTGLGRYLDESDIMRRDPFQTSDLFRGINGFRVAHRGMDEILVSSRGTIGFSLQACEVNVIIDGIQHMDIDMVHPSEIAAVETYASQSVVPAQYSMSSPCGAVVIWTKR